MSLAHLASAKELETHFFARLAEIISQQEVGIAQAGIAVAYSGGIDSTVLLHLVREYGVKKQIPIFAFHVNHGLSPHADEWQSHCQQACQENFKSAVHFEAANVHVDGRGLGVESAARTQRYRALGRMCRDHGVRLILTAHHMDDQAETMLLQLLRGTGLRGLAGMDDFNFAPDLFGNPKLLLARPLLKMGKSQLSQYLLAHGLASVNDESNDEIKYKRNAIRHLLMPVMDQVAPGFIHRFSRTADHVRSANVLLEELAVADLAHCLDEMGMDISKLKSLGADRIHNVFRQWLLNKGLKLPATAKLKEMLSQLLHARADARVSLQHTDFALHRYAGKIYLLSQATPEEGKTAVTYQWQGESTKHLPHLRGTLSFREAAVGVDAEFLRRSMLSIRVRSGGERLRLDKNRPSRDMKSHFQTFKVPFWQREKLPFIYLEERLLFVGLVGLDAAFSSHEGQQNIQITWLPDPA